MPSSTSNFESANLEAVSSEEAAPAAGIALREQQERPGFVRLTASDRPGVAQPVPERDIPPQPWSRIALQAGVVFVLLMAAWEWHWRAFGSAPGYRDSDGAWAQQRRRIDEGEGNATVLIGASRILFDVQLDEWQQATGQRPIQLALAGTSPMPVLEDLAADSQFTGRVVVDISTRNIFTDQAGLRGKIVTYYHEQSPSQRSGHWLSQHLLEPNLAFDDPDFALATVVRRLDVWPERVIPNSAPRVRKLSVAQADRDTHMWDKVENDPTYRQMVRDTWLKSLALPSPPKVNTPEKALDVRNKQIDRIVAAVKQLRARGARVVFLRPPSIGPWYEYEQTHIPRAEVWDKVLERTGAPGVYFEDYPELKGLDLPEWSHLSHADAKRFTWALAPLVEREFAKQ